MLIHNISKYINIGTTKMLLCTLVLSQLDYVNSILLKSPIATTKPYQTTQNIAAKLAYKKVNKRGCLHMSMRIVLATYQVQKNLQITNNSL